MLGEIKCQQNATLTQQAWDVDYSEAGKRHRTRLRVKLGLLSSTGTYKLGMLTVVQEYRDKQQDYMWTLVY